LECEKIPTKFLDDVSGSIRDISTANKKQLTRQGIEKKKQEEGQT
jgi:hypothetical protein